MFFNDELIEQLQKKLKPLTKKVKMLLFTQELECQYCRETRELLSELSQVSDKLELIVKNLALDKEEAEKYGIDKTPAIILLDEEGNDYGIRFFGIPSGYEFVSLLEGLLMLGTDFTGLPDSVIQKVKGIESPVHLQVFVTPTCPYCPAAVVTAHKFAYLNPNIKADMIEATEFEQLSRKYNVMGVPRTVINEEDFIEGAVPEQTVLNKILINLEKVN
jgi:glutaredoxin-like protein